MRRMLLLNKTTLSSTIRKKNSAVDNRISSKCLGSLGAIIIVGVCLSIVLADLSNIPKNKVSMKR
ncbi:hypothetical protein FSP39_014306 [Pinctada imbricata]|uniref:Uncharacterized protein n=1 Tax=Pinctada imbricata TaxID=66713 RepID=A0AA88YJG2_PINIB|nr:hypothetical protein FSP39_014306 [Pinctada imbricata]